MQKRQRSTFSTITSEGALLPTDVLERIERREKDIGGVTAEAYYHDGEDLGEVINDAWIRIQRFWKNVQAMWARLPESDAGTTLTRERWLLPLFSELGYGRLYTTRPLEVEGKSYDISHGWQNTPIHLISFKTGLDHLSRTANSSYRSSPTSLVQELLNRSPGHLWGMVTNGLRLRLLRQNVSMTRQAYVEFDLEAMMTGEVYADFVLFWLLCHQSRVEGDPPTNCWLEKWSRQAHEQGIRALDQLRNGVEQAINELGKGFLEHPANHVLRAKLREGTLLPQEYYRQVLRFIYRLIILFVAEDRDVLFHPGASDEAKACYIDYYSTARLRHLAEQRIGTRHSDLFYALWLIMEQLGGDKGCSELGLPALNGFLFSHKAVPDLVGCSLTNHALLSAVRELAFTYDKSIRRVVDYKNLGAEELGSVYESLLEMHPELTVDTATFVLKTAGGNERKTSGSYYTPTSLIDCLLDSALEPVLAEAAAKRDAEKAILGLKVCDPACGSGHFLIAAAHRIARRLAAVRTGTEEPSMEERRAALRDVVSHCIYGVDINPMAVELCKVNLWMEAIEPGKPLSFLDAHIQCGNSLLGATPALIAGGIPDSAFEPIEGDEKKICSQYKKNNKQHRATGQMSMFGADMQPWDHMGNLAVSMMQLETMSDDTVEELHRKQEYYAQLVASTDYLFGRLLSDAWCAAFVWKKTKEFVPPITNEEFRKIEQNPYTLSDWRKEEIQRLADQYQFFHWHLAFPDVFRVSVGGELPENEQAGWTGGFDVVLGNPPWERIKIQEKEWFAQRRPDIANAANAAARRRMIAALEYEDPALFAAFMEDQRKATGESHLVRDTGRYPLCGRGDVNTYSIFAENMRTILNLTGRVGCIVPSGIATDDTTKVFFQDLVTSCSLISLYDIENREGIFPAVDSRYKFCLLTLTGSSRPTKQGSEFAFFLHSTEELRNDARKFNLLAEDLALLNPNTRTCPIFRSERDMVLTKAVYKRIAILIKEGLPEVNPWNISFLRMFDMANASHLFRTRKQLEQDGWELKGNIFHKDGERCQPLYEGKMISHFDHRFGGYGDQDPRDDESEGNKNKDPYKLTFPRYWIHETHLPELMRDGRSAVLAFRDVARSTDIRTAIFCIIPVVACGDKLPIIRIPIERTLDLIYLGTVFSSFIFDYITRQKLGGTKMGYFILKQLPVLSISDYTTLCQWDTRVLLGNWILPRALELTYTAWDLETFAKDCGYNGPPFRWDEERRFLLRCELDAAYFHLYGIARHDVDYIMETFPIVKRKDEKQYGEYRTKHVILEIYDEMQRTMETCEPYRTRLEPPPADPAIAHEPQAKAEV